MNRSLVTALALCGVVAASAAAVAAPTLSFRFYEDGNLQAASSTSTSGVLQVNTSSSRFSVVGGFATGIPVLAAPSLTVQTTTISSLSSFGSGPSTIRLEYTQTEVPSASAGGLLARLANTMSANLLVNGDLIDFVTIGNYANANGAAFGTTTLLA